MEQIECVENSRDQCIQQDLYKVFCIVYDEDKDADDEVNWNNIELLQTLLLQNDAMTLEKLEDMKK